MNSPIDIRHCCGTLFESYTDFVNSRKEVSGLVALQVGHVAIFLGES
ncbi:MAG: hypothetical protein ACLGHE_05770 [Gammaproteobacteria bacterium]